MPLPKFNYFLYHPDTPALPGNEIWERPLPMNRKNIQKAGNSFPTHGDYFFAARSFLEKNRFGNLLSALCQCTEQSVSPEDICEINIFLEKHGEFYHPARVEVSVRPPQGMISGDVFSFVLNAAVSDTGRDYIRNEYHFLEKLNTDFSGSFLPRVYARGAGLSEKSLEIPMFLGEWFDGYHEFHISRNEQEKMGICVWDTAKGNFFLPRDVTKDVYRQAGRILTFYYNMETGEQIYPWHHAAGDFVIRFDKARGIGLKLITVRKYLSSFENKADDIASLMERLLVFLCNLSMRIRLDRLDGIGDMAWADEIAVWGMLDGFFESLASKPSPDFLPAPADLCFRAYLSSCTQAYLYELCEALVDTCNPQSPEVPVMKKYLKEHAAALYRAISLNISEISDE